MLASIKYWEKDAQSKKYAVPFFNVWNTEMLMGVIDAAEELKSPVIISFGTGFVDNTSFEDFSHMMVSMAKNSTVPVITEWDHGRSFEIVTHAHEYGMNAVMRDASALTFEENVKETKKVVDYFHPLGVAVEAELGHVGRGKGAVKNYGYTDPSQAAEFVKRTNCDSLAIAIGNVHGTYFEEPKINFDILKSVRDAVDVPLVLHGASGIGDEDIKKAISLGICKINIHTEIGEAATDAIKNNLNLSFVELSKVVREAIKQKAMDKIKLFGAENRAVLYN